MLCIRVEQLSQSQDEDFEAITKAVLEIEKQSQLLGEVTKSTETIRSSADKILGTSAYLPGVAGSAG